jgi:hypothetical protein
MDVVRLGCKLDPAEARSGSRSCELGPIVLTAWDTVKPPVFGPVVTRAILC